MASARSYSASGSAPKTFNQNGNARANSAKKSVSGNFTGRDLQRAKKMGNALVQAGRNRGASASTRPGR